MEPTDNQKSTNPAQPHEVAALLKKIKEFPDARKNQLRTITDKYKKEIG